MDLQDAIMVALESINNEVIALKAKQEKTSRNTEARVNRIRRIRELHKAYRILNAEYDRLDKVAYTP